MSNENKVVEEFRQIKQEYSYDGDVMNVEDERVHLLKYIINHRLSLVDKTIILLYADCQSYRKLGAKMGLSHMTIRKECLRIKKDILAEYEKLSRNETHR